MVWYVIENSTSFRLYFWWQCGGGGGGALAPCGNDKKMCVSPFGALSRRTHVYTLL
jgi:hypothetical protein